MSYEEQYMKQQFNTWLQGSSDWCRVNGIKPRIAEAIFAVGYTKGYLDGGGTIDGEDKENTKTDKDVEKEETTKP